MPDQWVKCTHPNLPDNEPILIPETSFNNLHSRQGWVLYVEDDVEDDVEPPKPRVLEIITKAENESIKADVREKATSRKAKTGE